MLLVSMLRASLFHAGIQMQVKQDSTAAQQAYDEAVAVCDAYAPAHYSQGVSLAAQLKVRLRPKAKIAGHARVFKRVLNNALTVCMHDDSCTPIATCFDNYCAHVRQPNEKCGILKLAGSRDQPSEGLGQQIWQATLFCACVAD